MGWLESRVRDLFLALVLTSGLVLLVGSSPVMAEKLGAVQLIELAKAKSAGLRDAIVASLDAKALTEGKAWAGHGADLFFATEAAGEPALFIDDAAGPKMQSVADSKLWYGVARIEQVGKVHSFYYMVDGKKFGGSLDLPVFGPDSYLQPGVSSGTLSEKIVHTSRIYDGMKAE